MALIIGKLSKFQILSGVADLAGAVDLGLSIYDQFAPDPLEEKVGQIKRKLSELESKIDSLNASLKYLGENLMAELKVTEDLIPTVAINDAVAEARSARAQLQSVQRKENPSKGEIRDAIRDSESALLRVLEQAEPKLRGDDPISALGFAGAIAFAAGVRLEVAFELEGHAIGKTSIQDSLSRSAETLRKIEATALDQLAEHLEVSTSVENEFPISGGFTRVTYRTQFESAASDDVYFVEKTVAVDSAQVERFRISTEEREGESGSANRKKFAQEDYEALEFDNLLKAADDYDTLSDGVEKVGTSRDNELKGTSGNDLLSGLAGDDVLRGLGDHDVLRGGSGRDRLFGQDGDDVLEGNNGRDRLEGGKGDDALLGGKSKDVLIGGSGDDQIVGGDGADTGKGGSGSDILAGQDGNDTLKGGQGGDKLTGGRSRDELFGGKGADEFLFETNPKRSMDLVRDFEDGRDTLVLENNVFRGFAAGELAKRQFDTDGRPDSKKATILYEDGVLYYDRDGKGSAAAVAFAELRKDPTLTADDFLII